MKFVNFLKSSAIAWSVIIISLIMIVTTCWGSSEKQLNAKNYILIIIFSLGILIFSFQLFKNYRRKK